MALDYTFYEFDDRSFGVFISLVWIYRTFCVCFFFLTLALRYLVYWSILLGSLGGLDMVWAFLISIFFHGRLISRLNCGHWSTGFTWIALVLSRHTSPMSCFYYSFESAICCFQIFSKNRHNLFLLHQVSCKELNLKEGLLARRPRTDA